MKHSKFFAKVLAVLCVCAMIVGILPLSAFAATDEAFVSETHDVFKSVESVIAPGVTQSIKYAYSKDGKQMVYYVATADITRDDVVVQTSYYKQHENGVMGMQKLTDQMAYAKEKYSNPEDEHFISEYYTPVVGTNASFYNMTTGQPTGVAYIDGVSFGTASYDSFFAILKDGTAVVDYRANVKNYTGDKAIMHAVGGSQWLVRDGKDVTANATGAYNTDRHCRTCVGITADGKVVMMSLDGRQEPFSCGGTMHELAQIMLEANCVAAINLDGGGSTTFASRPEGEENVKVINRPSDGSERTISSGLIIASTTAPTNVFDHVNLTADKDYVTPYSTVNVSAIGVSTTNNSADIPEGTVWQLADDSFGTIEDGVFVSNGKVGDVEIQMALDGKVVGSTTVHVVIPDLAFTSDTMTVPYNKTFELKVEGTTNGGMNTVPLKASDLVFELSDPSMGTIEGTFYTSCDSSEGITGGTITVKCAYDASKTATASVTFGKASVIVEDFEDGNIDGWSSKSGYARAGKGHLTYGRFERGSVALADANTGKVRNGNYSVALSTDWTYTTQAGYKSYQYTFPAIDTTGATTVGMWMYLPVHDVNNLEFDIGGYEYYIEDDSQIGDEGWYYITAPAATVGKSLSSFTIYITDPDETYFNIYNRYTIYVDDITLDYSNATEDREIPSFSKVNVVTGLDAESAVNGQTLAENTNTFKAYAAERLVGNYTGLDVSSARVYVDGIQLDASAYTCDSRDIITVGDLTLSNGTHTLRFEIDDLAGNTGFTTKTVAIQEENGDVYVARRSNKVQPLTNSVEYFDVIAKNIETIDTITLTLDLDGVNFWELQGAEVVYGFTMDYSVDEISNKAYITLTKTGEVELTGENVVAALPVRVWGTQAYLDPDFIAAGVVTNNPNASEADHVFTPEALWQKDCPRLINLEVTTESIIVEYTDDTVDTFSDDMIVVLTENNRYRTAGYYNTEGKFVTGDITFVKQGKASTHVHTAEAMADKAATCTEAGYTGRTYCAVCESVVEWGTVLEATGHDYKVIDGVLKCECGKLFNGEQDGVLYVDGLAAQGWIADSYYVDGTKLTGVQLIDGFYYDFGDNGICAGKTKFTGLFFDGEVWRYAQLGELSSGWKLIDNEWYYFRESTQAAPQKGYKYWDGTPYEFEENGKLISGVWVTTEEGTRYYYAGSSYYRTVNTASVAFYEIDGKTYGFDRNGYIYKDGVYGLGESNQKELVYYEFDADGVRTAIIDFKNYSGIIKTISGSMHYYVNGTPKQMGLIKIGDYFYYIRSGGIVATGSYNCTYNMTNEIPIGVYEFDANGRMLNVPEVKPEPDPDVPTVKNGIVNENGTLYYYIDDVKQLNLGLIEIEDNGEKCFIYVRTAGQLAVGKYKVWLDNGYVPYASEQDFGTDGKMKNAPKPDVKDGIVNEGGTLYYYIDGEKQVNLGLILVEIDGDKFFIYVRTAGQLAVGKYKVWLDNGYVPYASEQDFGTDGKMKNIEIPGEKDGIVKEGNTLYYYVNGEKQLNLGLIEIEVDGVKHFIYVRTAGQLAVGNYKVWLDNGYVPYASEQVFDANTGYMVTD